MSLNHQGTLTLTTNQLVLRPFILEDAAIFYTGITSNSLVREFFLIPYHKSLIQTQKMLKYIVDSYTSTTYNWVITKKENNEMIGLIRLFEVCEETKTAEIGYALIPNHWKQGYMQEALNTILNYLFTTVEFNIIEAKCMSENINSIRLLEKVKMKKVNIELNSLYWNNKRHDILTYQLTKQDYLSL